jgi:3-phenylpropionate/cinnamic acid dioxygenase small subunit
MVGKMLNEIDALLAKQACSELVLKAAAAVDAQDYDTFVTLFTQDAHLQRPGGVVLRGRAEILQAYRSKDPQRLTFHVISNHFVTLTAVDRAESRCKVMLYATDQRRPATSLGRQADAQQLYGVIHDALIRTDAGWKIQNRQAWFELLIHD